MFSDLSAQNLIQSTAESRKSQPARADAPEATARVSERQTASQTGQILPLGSETREKTASPSEAELSRAVSHLQDYVQNIQRDLQFSVDEDSGTTVIKVIDPETEEVIRQIPPEEVMTLSQRLEELAGVLIKAKA